MTPRVAGSHLVAITQSARTPHGYTLTIWIAASLLTYREGLPGPVGVLGFAVSGTVAFACLQALGQWIIKVRSRSAEVPEYRVPESISWCPIQQGGSSHVIGLVLVAAAVEAMTRVVAAPWCWPLGSALATVVFVTAHAVKDTLKDLSAIE